MDIRSTRYSDLALVLASSASKYEYQVGTFRQARRNENAK